MAPAGQVRVQAAACAGVLHAELGGAVPTSLQPPIRCGTTWRFPLTAGTHMLTPADFLLLVAAGFIFGNIISITVFKTRLF